MKKIISTILLLAGLIASTYAAQPTKLITGNLTGIVNWDADTIYILSGKVFVKSGGVLNIEAGTLIKADTAVQGTVLIVTRGAKINAIGTPTKPIVFTPNAPVGKRRSSQWGGICIAGNARLNVAGGEAPFEGGLLTNPDGSTTDDKYGGLNDADNSGTLKYVRIEYAGYPYQTNNELNGLTMGAVGNGTVIDYVQVSYGFDDSYEWFGGTVNCKHLIAFRGNDDDFDSDFGYRGNVQYGLVIRDTAIADPVSGANSFESDNDGTGSGNGPKTAAVFSNITLIGPKQTPTTMISANFRNGAHIRKNSRLSIFNSVFAGYSTGIKIDGDSCHANADSNLLDVDYNTLSACTKNLDSLASPGWGITNWFTTASAGNQILANNSDLMLTAPYNYTAPNCLPSTGSPLLGTANFTNSKIANANFDVVTYRGAFGATDWTAGWANFDPQNQPYLIGYGVTPASIDANFLLAANIYPNPANAFVSVVLPNTTNALLSLVDLYGKTIATFKYANQAIQIPTSTLVNGIYFLQIQNEGIQRTEKIVVLH
jgi:Secretion system C-terminal sorting domain